MAPPKPPPGFKLDEPQGTPPPPPGFQLDAPPPHEHGTTAGDAALQGVAQGASFGFADELAGIGAALPAGFLRQGAELAKTPAGRAIVRRAVGAPDDLPDAMVDAITESIAQETHRVTTGAKSLPYDPDAAALSGYRAARGNSRRDLAQAQSAHPKTTMGGQFAGAMLVPGPKSAAGAKGLARAAQLSKTGAAYGAGVAAGGSEEDLTDLEPGDVLKFAGDTAFGGALGGITGPLMGILADKARPLFERIAANNALRALGLRAGISNSLTKRGYESADDARELGKAALDMELIRPFRTASDVAERAGFAKQVQGSRIEGVLADADATGIPFDADEAAWTATSRLMGKEGLSPTALRESTRAQSLVEDILQQPKVQNPTFANANKLKSDMYQGINFGTDPALKTQLEKRAAGGLRSSIEEQVSRVSGPDAADELRAANQAYGFLQDIEPLAQDEATRQLARVPWHDPKTIAAAILGGAGGHQVGGPGLGVGGAVLPLAARAIAPRVPSTLAVGARAAAPRVGPALEKLTGPAIQTPLRDEPRKEEEDSIRAFLEGAQ